jgi:hypothetical protein
VVGHSKPIDQLLRSESRLFAFSSVRLEASLILSSRLLLLGLPGLTTM